MTGSDAARENYLRLRDWPKEKLRFVRPQLLFELSLAIVQGLQAQLPAMQLNAELIDVTGDLGPLRFVLGELAANFFCIGQRIRTRFLRRRHSSEFAALLAGQGHSGGGSIYDQRRLAVLAMKENIGIGCDLAQGMFCRFSLHGKSTSRRCAEGGTAIRQTREITPKKESGFLSLTFCPISRLFACLAEVLSPCRIGARSLI